MRNQHTNDLLQMAGELLDAPIDTTSSMPAPLWAEVVGAGWDRVGTPEELGGVGGSLVDAATLTRAVARYGHALPLGAAQLLTWIKGNLTDADSDLGSIAWLSNSGSGPTIQAEVRWFDEKHPLLVVSDLDLYQVSSEHCSVIGRHIAITGDPVTVIRFDHDVARPLSAKSRLDEALAIRNYLGAAQLLGAAEGAYRIAREYTSVREQFGRSLDSIPSVRSALARTKIDLGIMEAGLDRASAFFEASVSLTASMSALGVCGDRAAVVAETCHQLCGALGTTLEHSLHACTRQIWGTRSDDEYLHDALVALGHMTLSEGESFLWDELTAVPATWEGENA